MSTSFEREIAEILCEDPDLGFGIGDNIIPYKASSNATINKPQVVYISRKERRALEEERKKAQIRMMIQRNLEVFKTKNGKDPVRIRAEFGRRYKSGADYIQYIGSLKLWELDIEDPYEAEKMILISEDDNFIPDSEVSDEVEKAFHKKKG